MAKRRFISQLPAVLQTQGLQKFFNPTVDQLFQPGETQSINAFIGKKPSYYDPTKDFYKDEINTERAFYQLEPAMTSKLANATSFSELLFYQDLANNLRFHGGNVDNHERLFETDFYSWCPPVNIKKLVNYREYYWLPDGPPTMIFTIPVTTATGDGVTTVFSYPQPVHDMVADRIALVNGVQTTAFTSNSTSIIFDVAPPMGATIAIYLNGDFKQNIEGKASFTYTGLATSIASQVQQQQNIVPVVDTWETKVWDKTEDDPWEMNTALVSQQVLVDFGPQDVTTNPQLAKDMRIRIVDNRGSNEYIVDFQDGVIVLLPVLMQSSNTRLVDNDLVRTDPYYWTIERGAISKNPWSRTNHWYHKSVLTYQDSSYAPYQAQRPIIEFFSDLVPYNYGTHVIDGVDYVYDRINNNYGATLAQLNGIRTEESPFLPGKRILAYQTTDVTYQNAILETTEDQELDYFDTQGFDSRNYDDYTDVINFHVAYQPTKYDQTDLNGDPAYQDAGIVYTNDQELWTNVALGDTAPTSYWFNGTSWKSTQSFTKQPPLFQLYDSQNVEVDDLTKYPNSTFAGNKIFAYKLSTDEADTIDTVLGVRTIRNDYGQFEYFDHTATLNDNTGADSLDSITYGTNTADPQSIPGYRYYALTNRAATSQDTGYQIDFAYDCTWHEVGKTTQIQNANGLWEIPLNLQANPLNDEVTTISANDWNAHFTQILQASDWTRGSREVTLHAGTYIVQSSESLLKNMFLNSNSSTDFIRAIAYVEREYLRYRNKFVQYVNKLHQTEDISDASAIVVRTLTALKLAKTPDFPFHNSGMASIAGNTTDWYMPASGAYLGMTPLWEPEYLVAYSATKSILQIKGHDGSLVNGYSVYDGLDVVIGPLGVPVDSQGNELDIDPRDAVLLAFEKVIYDSADTSFKVRHRPELDLLAVTTGKFRTGEYTRDEYLALTRPSFERWAAMNNREYRKNTTYDAMNPFTWNYSDNQDIDGESVPGYWRGMYKWYFDTDRPHTHPWEMLGYTFKPAWWDTYYSWTDAGKRQAMIAAFQQGLVSDPSGDQEINPVFARPNIGNRIPVDMTGKLLDPITANIIVDNGVYNYSKDWEWGDGSPIESQWMTSQMTSFAQAELLYLMKPVRFAQYNWASLDTATINEQFVTLSTLKRMVLSQQTVHNEVVDSQYIRVLGMETWISDYIKSMGQDITTTFGDPLRAVGVNLSHKLGGFCDPATIKTFTENFGLIPQENVSTALYRSPSIQEEFYGGVIVEWTGAGWKVYGYDSVDPVFNILPAIENGPKSKISITGETESSPYTWYPNTYYAVNVLVTYKNSNYRCNKTHTSGSIFEQQYWTAEPTAKYSPSGSVLWYKKNEPVTEVERVPYGTLFGSRQEVATFLSGYSAYLISRGWVFDSYNPDTNDVNDWEKSTKEFLMWTQSQWSAGTFIALSPAATSVKFASTYGTIQNVEQLVNGTYSVLSREGASVPKNNVTVNRTDDQIVVGVTEGGIFGLRIFKSEIEHVIVFDNLTIFQNVIYDPLYNIRQNRIRLTALMSTDWAGRLDAPGFIVTDNLLVPSFDRQVEDIRYTYDMEVPIKLPLRDNARHQIGYQSRTYLENIMLNELNQFEFYQGMIKQKGTPSIYNKLLRSQELTSTRDLAFLEEWAVRSGMFGGVDAKTTFEFELHTDYIKQEPQLIEFKRVGFWDIKNWDEFIWDDALTRDELTALDSQEDTAITLYTTSGSQDSRWVTPLPQNTSVFFPTKESYVRNKGYLPSAGYARTSESTWQAINFTNLQSQVTDYTDDIVVGDKLWVYANENATWGMYVVDNVSSDNFANNFESSADGLTITFDNTPVVNVGEYVYLTKEVLNDLSTTGFYKVQAVDTNLKTILIDAEILADREYAVDETRPTIFRLYDSRASLSVINNELDVNTKKNIVISNTITQSQLSAAYPQLSIPSSGSFQDGDLVYVDFAYEFTTQDATSFLTESDKRWGVFKYNATANLFELYRTQPVTIRRDLVRDIRIFDNITKRDDTQLDAKPLLYQDILTYDPIQGLIPGVAAKEIWYRLEDDPACYNISPTPSYGFEWGAAEVGRLWWDLSTTRYLLAETDIDTEDELVYRKANWGQLAPSSTVDIYEWVESSVSPSDWQTAYQNGSDTNTYNGAVYSTENYVQTTKWDDSLGSDVTVYYFWVKNRPTVPVNDETRETSAQSVSQILTNPVSSGLSWMAPLTTSSIIVAGIAQYLTQNSTLNIQIAEVDYDAPQHSEWTIIRKGDERSLPDRTLWNKFCISLTGRDSFSNVVPDPQRYVTDQVGYDVENGQSLFSDLKSARKHLVKSLNTILARSLIADTRRDATVLNGGEGDSQYLIWNQKLNSYYREPYPVGSDHLTNNNGLWNYRFDSESGLTAWDQAGNSRYDTNGLITRFDDENTFWSVMEMDRWDDAPVGSQESDFDVDNWDAPNIRRMWSYQVDTLDERDALLQTGELTRYDFVRVNGDSSTSNYWSLWRLNAAMDGWELIQMQRYRTNDCWSYVDWYQTGYSTEPVKVYATIADRNAGFALDQTYTFVKVLDDGYGRWMWNVYQDGIWEVVAKQNGTIALNDSIWSTTGTTNFINVPPTLTTTVTSIPTDIQKQIANRDRGYELNFILNSLRDNILTNSEINELMFALIEYVHTEQNFVDWVFKTSFMYITGFNETLNQKPIQNVDYTQYLIDYINEVKPYHVKIRDFTNKYATPIDTANVSVWDYDKPMYLDKTTNTYRLLDPLNTTDQVILQTGIYKNWYSQYLAGNNLVRKLNLTSQYSEEIPVSVSGSVRIRVSRRMTEGATITTNNVVDTGETTASESVVLGTIVPDIRSVAVFSDGVRVNPTQVTLDEFVSTATWNKVTPDASTVEFAAFGYGITGTARDILYWEKKNGVNTFDIGYQDVVRSQLQITLAGSLLEVSDPLDASNVSLNGSILTINPSLPNGLVQVVVMDDTQVEMAEVITHTFQNADIQGKTFADLYPEVTNTARWPLSENFVFEVSGIRKNIELAYNINVTEANRVLRLDVDADVNNLKAQFAGEMVQIGTDLRRTVPFLKEFRCVQIGVDTTIDQITVWDENGNQLVVGEIISSYPFPDVEIDPYNVPIRTTQTLVWENNNLVIWDDETDQTWDYMGDQPSIRINPTNANLVLWKDYLMTFDAIPQDMMLTIRFKDFIPTNYSEWEWTPQSAPLVKINNAIAVTNYDYGLLKVVDSTPAHRDLGINDIVDQNAEFVSITDMWNPELMGTRNHVYTSAGQELFPISALPYNDSAIWINLNGKRLILDKDYKIIDTDNLGSNMYPAYQDEMESQRYRYRGLITEDQNTGWANNAFDTLGFDTEESDWDIAAWDSNQWDDNGTPVVTKAVQILAGTTYGDVLTITVFPGVQTQLPHISELMIHDSEAGNHGVYHDIPLSSQYVLISGDLVTEEQTPSITVQQRISPRMFPPTQEAFGDLVWIEAESVDPQAVSISLNGHDHQVTMTDVTRGTNITSVVPHANGARVTVAYQDAVV